MSVILESMTHEIINSVQFPEARRVKVDGVGNPYSYRGSWLWPVDGYYDVHDDENGRPSDEPSAELLSLAEAKKHINDRRRNAAIDRMFS